MMRFRRPLRRYTRRRNRIEVSVWRSRIMNKELLNDMGDIIGINMFGIINL